MDNMVDVSYADFDEQWVWNRLMEGTHGISVCAWTGVEVPGGVAVVRAKLERWLRVGAQWYANLTPDEQAGLRKPWVTAYTSVVPQHTGKLAADMVKVVTGEYWPQLVFAAVDCEIAGITEDQVAEALDQCDTDDGAGKPEQPAWVYTRGSWWEPYLNDTHRFADRKQWDANYDDIPSLERYRLGSTIYLYAERNYGGWTVPAAKQYRGDFLLDGERVDLNVVELEEVG